MKYLLGLDLGTTAIKIAVFDVTGKEIASANHEYELVTPGPGIVELPAETYWDTFCGGLKEVMEAGDIAKEDLLALSISAQSETMIPVDRNGIPVRNAIVWMDTRAQDQAECLSAMFPKKRINEVTGQTDMLAIWPCSKILWMKENEPEIFARVSKFLLIEDYFLYRFTGKYYGEGSLWSSSLMWNIIDRKFWPEMLDALSLTEDRLPEIIDSAVDIGTVLPDVASSIGLSSETHVVTGGLDGFLGAMGVGNVVPGVFSESGGSSLTACLLTEKPFFDANLEMPCFYSPVKGTYLITAFSSGGICYRWMRDKFCAEEMNAEKNGGPDAYYLMDKEAEGIPAGCEGLTVLPHFLGAGMPDTDSYAKCSIFGLTLSHTKAHLIRGFMEGVATVLRRMVESLENSGIQISQIVSMGGGAKSRLWCQIKCDATGKPVYTLKATDDSACLGAAMLAGVGIGIWNSAEEAYNSFSMETDRRFEPNPAVKPEYDKLYDRYVLLMKLMKSVNSQI